MEAYCEEVRCLEDKFHGLELNHIARRYNEAADELTKIASSQTTVPPKVFARDVHQPSIDIRADGEVDGPSFDPPPEAEALHQPTPSLTGVFRTSTISLEGTSSRIRSRLNGSLAEPNPL
jgi:hypothetical protein